MTCLRPAPVTSAPVLRQREFNIIRRLAYQYCGLDLHNGKQGLVASRLTKTLRELDLRSYSDYVEYVTSDRSGAALAGMVDRLTTNHTSFFREPAHFEFLRKSIFPALRNRSRIHIWSAACSTGEEPYSIAMSLLEESPREATAKVKIKATDISTRALDKARSGAYAKERLVAISSSVQQRYLVAVPEAADTFRFIDNIRFMINFEYLNLISALPAGYRCSVIFCRNLMIYFDRPTQQALVHRLTQHLEDNGYLFIGHAETLHNIDHALQYVCPAIYRKPSATHDCQSGYTKWR
jgi:chemotaxis protein methyltransferase CheR